MLLKLGISLFIYKNRNSSGKYVRLGDYKKFTFEKMAWQKAK
jgi:hypothetical protein